MPAAVVAKGSVHIRPVRISRFASNTVSSILPDLRDPQSQITVLTASQLRAISSTISGPTGTGEQRSEQDRATDVRHFLGLCEYLLEEASDPHPAVV